MATPKKPVAPKAASGLDAILNQYKTQISPMGTAERDRQMKAAQDALMKKRMQTKTYNNMGTN